jgi:PAS domain S-box-containing protein
MDIATGACHFSDEFFRICGYEPGGFPATAESSMQLIHPDDLPTAAAQVAAAIDQGIPYQIEKRIVRPDGSIRWVYSMGEITHNNQQQPAKLIGAFLDITERKQAEDEIRTLNRNLEQRNEELQDLNRELETFGYAIAHHLRSPLWTARLCAEAIREDNAHQMDRTSLELLQTIENTIERMNQTIERLLLMAALTREHLASEPVNLSAMAREIAQELCHREPARQVSFVIEPNMVVVGDERLLHMLLENLLENAWKYTSKRATAEISFARQQQPDSAAQVYVVRDNGAGFDQARAADSFRAFQRLHANSDFPGTGIGLAMVRRIVHLHGGHIWAESARDQGAAFFFTLE